MEKGIFEAMREMDLERVKEAMCETANAVTQSFMPCPAQDLPMIAAVLEMVSWSIMAEARKSKSIKDADRAKELAGLLLDMTLGSECIRMPKALADAMRGGQEK